jgi:hypothetical protein
MADSASTAAFVRITNPGSTHVGQTGEVIRAADGGYYVRFKPGEYLFFGENEAEVCRALDGGGNG